jgi:hypothetical protein
MISFDVKGAYCGVYTKRLLGNLTARGIPPSMVHWVNVFCSGRSASILINGLVTLKEALAQPGLPQGSPLSPIIFIFFNADLVQNNITAQGGSIAFVDDYTAWTTGPTTEANREAIKTIIERLLQ